MRKLRSLQRLFLRLVLAAAAVAITPAAIGQANGFATGLKPGDRVTVDIAGYTYQAQFKAYVPCRDSDGNCASITDDDGTTKSVLLRYLKPPVAGAAQTAAANKTTKPAPGKYTCSFYSGYLQNVPGFTLVDGSKFKDHVGTGQWNWEAASRTLAFKGGAWNGQKLQTTSSGSLQVLRADGSAGAVSCSRG